MEVCSACWAWRRSRWGCDCTALYCIVQYSIATVLYSTEQYSHSTVLYCTGGGCGCTVLYCTVVYCTVQVVGVAGLVLLFLLSGSVGAWIWSCRYCTLLYCTLLYCIVLYSTVLCDNSWKKKKKVPTIYWRCHCPMNCVYVLYQLLNSVVCWQLGLDVSCSLHTANSWLLTAGTGYISCSVHSADNWLLTADSWDFCQLFSSSLQTKSNNWSLSFYAHSYN